MSDNIVPARGVSLVADTGGVTTTTTLIVAEGTGNEHESVMRLVANNSADFEEFGILRFQVGKLTEGRGAPTKYALLNEEQATLLMTYLRNTPVVRGFKKRLVRAFFELRERAAAGRTVEPLSPLEYARRLVDAEERVIEQEARAVKAEAQRDAEQKHRRAIEGGDGIDPTTFAKKYFSAVRKTDFDKHLYEHGYLINQLNTRTRADGSRADGYDHRKPTAKGRAYFYAHDNGVRGGRRRFVARIIPQAEIALRDRLAADGLPVNEHSTGLVLLTNEDMKELGA